MRRSENGFRIADFRSDSLHDRLIRQLVAEDHPSGVAADIAHAEGGKAENFHPPAFCLGESLCTTGRSVTRWSSKRTSSGDMIVLSFCG